MKFKIKNRFHGNVQAILEGDSFKAAFELGVKNNANFKGADLRNADLKGADLKRADLRWACLEGAYLRKANLRLADLEGVDLRGANLEGVDFLKSNFRLAEKLPKYLPVHQNCKWLISISKKLIKIGCETKTSKEWKQFFKEKQSIETDPENPDYELIKLSFEYADKVRKHYVRTLKNWDI